MLLLHVHSKYTQYPCIKRLKMKEKNINWYFSFCSLLTETENSLTTELLKSTV
jgi:hypothetical protein